MAVQQTTRTARVPAQSAPVEPPPAAAQTPAPAPADARPIGRDRPRTREEQEFVLGAAGVFGGLAVLIVVFLLLAQYVW